MNYAIIFAGGTGKRMLSIDLPKQFIEINSIPVIIRTLQHFEHSKLINKIIVVCLEQWISYLQNLINKYNISKVLKIVEGGETGTISIRNGVYALKNIANPSDLILIHDGVRPNISEDLIESNILIAKTYGNCISGVNCTETIGLLGEDNNYIKSIENREKSVLLKAPQTFKFKNILEYHQKAEKAGLINITDSATLANMFGEKLYYTKCSYTNIKLTTPNDLDYFKVLINNQQETTNLNKIYDRYINIIKEQSFIKLLQNTNKNFLITGGSGFIGRIVCFVIQQIMPLSNIYLITKDKIKCKHKIKLSKIPINLYKLNILSYEELNNVKDIDYILHLASPTQSDVFFKKPATTSINIFELTKTILDFAIKIKASKIVYTSSLEVYGEIDKYELSENDLGFINLSKPRNSYPESKRMSEMLVSSYFCEFSLPYAIVRFPQIIGPGVTLDDKRVYMHIIKSFIYDNKVSFISDGSTTRDYLDVFDAALSLILLCFKGTGVYNIANNNLNMSILELAQELAKYFDNPTICTLNTENQEVYLKPFKHKLNTSKARELDIKPIFDKTMTLYNMVEDIKFKVNEADNK